MFGESACYNPSQAAYITTVKSYAMVIATASVTRAKLLNLTCITQESLVQFGPDYDL